MSKRAKAARARATHPGTSEKRERTRDVFVVRPFEGLVDEPQWIALREFVPAASAPCSLAPEYAERYGDRPVMVATVLPMAVPAMSKQDGRVLLGMQRQQQSGDVSRDLAATLLSALEAPLGESVPAPALPGPGPRLQDVLVDAPLDVTLHSTFEFWLDGDAEENPQVRASLERANASIVPTTAVASVRAGYWSRLPDRAHVRWVLPDAEDRALEALARIGANGGLPLGEGTRFAGMFRAHGRLVPVWDLPAEPEGEHWDAPMEQFAKRYADALAIDRPLSGDEQRSRRGLLGRQLTLR